MKMTKTKTKQSQLHLSLGSSCKNGQVLLPFISTDTFLNCTLAEGFQPLKPLGFLLLSFHKTATVTIPVLNQSHHVRQTVARCAGTAGGPSDAPGKTAPARTS